MGGDGNDTLLGEAGNDILAGGSGDDSLTGASTTTNGLGEIDRLYGEAGADSFVLGTATTAFYDDGDNTNHGIADYALIHDFDDTEDIIELYSGETYYLDANPFGTISGQGIFIDNDGTGGLTADDELIGLLDGTSLPAGQITGSTPGFSFV